MPDPITPPVVTPAEPVTTPPVAPVTPPTAPITPPVVTPTTKPADPVATPVTPPVTTPPAAPTPPVTPAVTPPAVDPQELERLKTELTKTATETAEKGIMAKLGKALGFTKEETDELPKTKEELTKVINKSIKDVFTKRLETQRTETKETQDAQDDRVKTIVTNWHNEYHALSQAGKAPKIVDPNNQSDPGVLARQKLILGVGKIIATDKAKGVSRTPALAEVLVFTPQVLTGPPGADLPISGNTGSAENEASFSNAEVNKKSFAEIAAGL